jgi:hypothetical protein
MTHDPMGTIPATLPAEGRTIRNRFEYAEVVIETCTGDTNTIRFDTRHRYSVQRAEATRVLSVLSVIACTGSPVSVYRKDFGRSWFKSLPSQAHITRLSINKGDRRTKQVNPDHQCPEREYTCEHSDVAA